MSKESLSGAVAWTVEPTPPEVAVVQGVAGAVGVVWTLVTAGSDAPSAGTPSWDLPGDPDAFGDLGRLRLSGTAPWLPAGNRHLVRATSRDAWLGVGRGQRPSVRVPLEELRVTGARSLSRSRRPRHAAAPWELSLAGTRSELLLDGPWLSLAWLGHLAGWPEPTPRAHAPSPRPEPTP